LYKIREYEISNKVFGCPFWVPKSYKDVFFRRLIAIYKEEWKITYSVNWLGHYCLNFSFKEKEIEEEIENEENEENRIEDEINKIEEEIKEKCLKDSEEVTSETSRFELVDIEDEND